MAKMTKLVMMTCTAFLERQNPVSTMAKPACMKNTSAPPKIRKKMFSEIFTCPRSAAISLGGGAAGDLGGHVAGAAGRRARGVAGEGETREEERDDDGHRERGERRLQQRGAGP